MKKLKLISLILAVVMMVSMLPLAGMFSAFAAEDSQQPAADDDWYTRETTDATPTVLEINNQDDLFAFAEKLSEGTTTAPAFVVVDETTGTETQLTVKLNTHIILNDGWDALNVTKSEDVETPAVTYPVASSAFFGGIFDGQGHVLSGLYVNGNALTGLFGNVPTGYTATVKNVIIKNSFIQGNGQAIGTIFGSIEDQAWQETHVRYGKETKGIVENVYIEATVSCTSEGNTNLGTGGFVGGSRAYLDVKDSAFVGNVFGGVRGTAGVVGQTRSKEMTGTNQPTFYGTQYWPAPTKTTVENVYIEAYLVGSNKSKDQAGCAGIAGYINAGDEDLVVKNVVLNCTFGTEQFNDDGTEVLKKDTSTWDGDGTSVVEERETYNRTAYLFGHTYFTGLGGANDVKYDPENDLTDYVSFDWSFDNVYYVKDQANKIKYEGAYFSIGAKVNVTINGQYMDTSYDPDTGVNPEGLFTLTNWAEYQAALEAQKTDPTVKLPTLMTDIAEISYYGEVRTYQGVTQYAKESELRNQLILNYFNDECALGSDADEDWGTTLSTKMTDLDATQWVEYGEYLLPLAVYDMVSDAKEAMDLPSATPTVDADWYDNSTADGATELVIYNADDLLAFAAAIEAGKNFAGLTVKLNTNITLNDGWDAFAETVTAPTTVWPLASANKSFAGTFDGQGKTISGIYLNHQNASTTYYGVGIFGNVYADTIATVKNVSIVNSYVCGNVRGVGGLFGAVHGENVTAAVTTNNGYVGKTKAVIDNVLADINVVGTSKGNAQFGIGGMIGGVASDATVTNSAFIGSVQGGYRGVAAVIGSVYAMSVKEIQADGTNVAEFNGSWANNAIFRNTITMENLYVAGNVHVIDGGRGHGGGLIGYLNDHSTTVNLENIVCTSEITEGTGIANANYLGPILGGCYSSAAGSTKRGVTDFNEFHMSNVLYTSELREFAGNGNKYFVDGVEIVDTDTEDEKALLAIINETLTNVQAEDLSTLTADWEGWSDANGMPLPTAVFNSFYTGLVGQSVTLSKDLGLSVYVKTDGTKASYTGAFLFNVDLTTLPADTKISEHADAVGVISEHVGNNIHKFTLTGILPYQMGDVIVFSFGEDEGIVVTSVQAYLANLLASDAELASAMLRWGAASQTVAEYKTDALVTTGLDLAAATDTTANLTNNATFSGTESADNYVKGVEMFVEDGVLKLTAKAFIKDASFQQGISVTVADRETIHLNYQELTPVETENRTYTAIFSNIDISNMNDVITLVILESNGGNVLSQTLTTDMDDIVATFLASGAEADDVALVKAMHAVGVALAD